MLNRIPPARREWLTTYRNLLLLFLLTGFTALFTACETKHSLGLQESLDTIPELNLIHGAENSAITVNQGTDSYFTFNIGNISPNQHIAEGQGKGWCILWNKPIDSNNTTHSGLRLLSSYGDKQWKPLNYLLNIRESLMLNDSDISYREIQAAIWTLMDFPEFNLNNISTDQLPPRMVQNGQYNFDRNKTNQIVKHVKENYNSFEYSSASTYAVVAETPSDTQTIIIEVSESVWARGQHSFQDPALREKLGIKGEGKGQWGWILELDNDFSVFTTDLIAGGGSNDGSAEETGTTIGMLEVSTSGNSMEISYNAYNSYLLNDLHLWAGCSIEEFPWVGNTGKITPADHTFSYNDKPTASHSFTVNPGEYNCSENIYLAAYAGKLYQKSNGNPPENPSQEPVFKITDLSQYGLQVAWDINDHGHIAGGGSYWNSETQAIQDMGNIFARSLNNKGVVVGDAGQNAVMWDAGNGLIVLDKLGAGRAEAHTVNNHGQTAGELWYEEFLYEDCYYTDEDETDEYCEDIYDYTSVSFVWTEQDGSEAIGTEGGAYGNNDKDHIVGIDYSVQNRGYIWDHQTGIRSLGSYTGFSSSNPNAINYSGQVTGSALVSEENNLIASKTNDGNIARTIRDMDKLLRLTKTKGMYDARHVAEMIRSSSFDKTAFPWRTGDNSVQQHKLQTSDPVEEYREIYDLAQNISYRSEPFIWDEAHGIQTLGTLGGEWGTAWDINDHGQVVGYGDIGNGEHRAFFWDPEHGLIELPSFGGNSLARAINNDGEIVGYSYDDQGNFRPARWTLSYE